MTVQELSTIAGQGIDVTVVIVDKDGYTVERAIHGPEAPFNNIARWDWAGLVAAMTPGNAAVGSARARIAPELARALEVARATPVLTLVEAVVARMDVPRLLAQTQARWPGALPATARRRGT